MLFRLVELNSFIPFVPFVKYRMLGLEITIFEKGKKHPMLSVRTVDMIWFSE